MAEPSVVDSLSAEIHLAAYAKWESRGRPWGTPLEDWLWAERLILGKRRTNASGPDAGVPLFEELRSNGHGKLANALTSLFLDYPSSEHAELKARMGVESQIMDTLLELAAFRVLHLPGHRVKEIHPDLSLRGLKNRPDFLVDLADGREAIVEVTCGSPLSQKLKDQNQKMDDMLRGLDPHMQRGDWWFHMSFQSEIVPRVVEI
jgi:hypothetical protein